MFRWRGSQRRNKLRRMACERSFLLSSRTEASLLELAI
jgi:hypothetical protein